MQVFVVINPPPNTAFTVFHKLWNIVLTFSFFSMYY